MRAPDAPGAGLRVAVVGGGIAGLTTAFRLQQSGCAVLVLDERPAETVGGRMAGRDCKGFALDLGAPLLGARYGSMVRLIADAGLIEQVLPARDVVGTVHGGRVHRSRTGSLARVAGGQLLAGLPVRDRLRILADLRAAASHLTP